MIDTIYIENAVASSHRTESILAKFPGAARIPCEHYGEIFNRRRQNFRLQKRKPALILANKYDAHVLKTPTGYGIGGETNYYFSHMLNCIYDCRYCFLQGMYQSAHYVLFVNYEDFADAIVRCANAQRNKEIYYFSGYDCDSLALDHITDFVSYFMPVFAQLENTWVELRTKSVQIRSLTEQRPLPRVVVAFSLSPAAVVHSVEHKTPSIERRIEAMSQLASLGWKLGLRVDPILYFDDYQTAYRELFEQVFSNIPIEQIHSVSLGTMRFPKAMFDKVVDLYPTEVIFAGPLESNNGMTSYRNEIQEEILTTLRHEMLQYVSLDKLFL